MSGEPPKPEIHSAGPKPEIKIWPKVPVESPTIYGVENELLVLQKMLSGAGDGRTNGFKAIAITGVRGIGKSALCQALLQNPDVKSKYLLRILVSTKPQDSKITLLKRILFCLGVEVDAIFPGDQTVPGLLYAIRLQLRSKRFLIVLDDAQEEEIQEQGIQEQGNQEQGSQEQGSPDWYGDLNSKSEEIGEKLRDGFRGGNGGAVIVTSRSEEEAESMVGEGNLRRLVPHKDPEEFWKIFEQEVQKGGDSSHIPSSSSSSSNLKGLKMELMNRCGGLPLAAKMMGQIKLDEISDHPPSQT